MLVDQWQVDSVNESSWMKFDVHSRTRQCIDVYVNIHVMYVTIIKGMA